MFGDSDLPTPEAIVTKCKGGKCGPAFSRAWDGDLGDYNGDQSRADLAVCSRIAFFAGDNPQLIDEVFRLSALKRDKWDRDDYRLSTIGKAIGSCKNYYQWPVKKVKKKKPKAAQLPRDPNKIGIEITTEEHKVNDKAVAALAKARCVYNRGGNLVEVIQTDESSRGIESSASQLRVVKITPPRIRELLSKEAFFYTIVGRGTPDEAEVPAHPPTWCVNAVAERGAWCDVPVIRGVVDTPVFRRDGTIADQSGFDESTGLLLVLSRQWPKVPETPTPDDAKAAVASLFDVIRDFPLNDDQRPAWLSLVLTPFARQAFNGPAPSGTIDANVQGAGKGLLADVIGIIATGTNLDRMSSPTDDNEMRKRITSIALAAQTFVLIDNHVGRFGWPSHDAVLTSDTWSDRLLGTNSTFCGPISTLWLVTGNNIQMSADAMRRTIYIRMDSKDQCPEERTGFAFPDLRAEVRRRRPELVAACLTILRYFHINGRPNITGNSLGSFEGWSDLIRQAVANVTGVDPLKSRELLRSTVDSDTTALGTLLECWEEAYPDGRLVADALREVVPHEVLGNDTRSPAERALCDAILNYCPGRDGKLPTPRSLGARLKSIRLRVVNDRRFDSDTERLGERWRVMHLT